MRRVRPFLEMTGLREVGKELEGRELWEERRALG